jgi:hypothetical protein
MLLRVGWWRTGLMLGRDERCGLLWRMRCRSLDDLVQFAAIQPDAAAFGAVIDLDPLALGHDQVRVVDGAFLGPFLSMSGFGCRVDLSRGHCVGSDDPCANGLSILDQALHAPMPRGLSERRRHAPASMILQERRQVGELLGQGGLFQCGFLQSISVFAGCQVRSASVGHRRALIVRDSWPTGVIGPNRLQGVIHHQVFDPAPGLSRSRRP